MTLTTALLDRDIAAARAFDGLDESSLPRERLLAAQEALARIRHDVDAQLAIVTSEVGRRSAADAVPGGLARREGYASPQQLVADKLGVSVGEAGRLMDVGRAMSTAPGLADAGETEGADASPAPLHPHVTEALLAGRLSVEKAAVISRCLGRIDGDVGELERRIVEAARTLPLAHVRRMCELEWARRQPADLEARERRQRAERALTVHEDGLGMTSIRAQLDPVSAAPVRAWLDAQVKAAFQRKREHPEDDRDASQIRADALVMLAEHGLDCASPTSGVKTTVLLRTNMADLEAGLGIGSCDSLPTPISVPTLRRMAVDAEILPVVMGGASLPLDLGRRERLFNVDQRIAMAERDGGCAFCLAPPAWCHAHHIRWWGRDGGRTDLNNGVLLCTSCHHRIHDCGWEISVRDGTVWFIPPPDVDPERRPRPSGLARLAA
jgi:hypothetical protein